MAGIRLGIGYMNEEILSYYNRVKAPYNISVINQQTAMEALNNEEKFTQEVRAILIEKQRLIQNLSELKMIKKTFPSDANFLLVEVENAGELYGKLIEKKIIIRNRNSVIKNCVRISVGTFEENEELLNALKELNND